MEKETKGRVYYLKTCNTCMRIIKSLQLTQAGFIFQDIKEEEITVKQFERLRKLAGSYEALFSRRAKLYKEKGLADENLTETDYRQYLLEHYTFLRRPVIIKNDQIFIGNSKKTIEAARLFL